MAGRKRRFVGSTQAAGVLLASGPGRFRVVLVVLALFFCHGAFGYAHQLTPVDVPASHVGHAVGDPRPAPDGDAGGAHVGDAYFATLLALFFGTFLVLGGRVSAGTKLAVPAVAGRVCGTASLPPPRGPTLSSLQVFRL